MAPKDEEDLFLVDADEMQRALKLPAIKVKGKVYKGRIVSQLEHWEKFHLFEAWAGVKKPQQPQTADEMKAAAEGALEFLGFDADAQRAILGLPSPVVARVMRDFFGHLKAQRELLLELKSETPGPNSPRGESAEPSALAP